MPIFGNSLKFAIHAVSDGDDTLSNTYKVEEYNYKFESRTFWLGRVVKNYLLTTTTSVCVSYRYKLKWVHTVKLPDNSTVIILAAVSTAI